jgi:hypothetical protein
MCLPKPNLFIALAGQPEQASWLPVWHARVPKNISYYFLEKPCRIWFNKKFSN